MGPAVNTFYLKVSGEIDQVTSELQALLGSRGIEVVIKPANKTFAQAAFKEDLGAGKEGVAPYWRVVQNDGGLNPKFPGGVEAQAARLRGEGHEIQHIGRKARVVNFQSLLQEL